LPIARGVFAVLRGCSALQRGARPRLRGPAALAGRLGLGSETVQRSLLRAMRAFEALGLGIDGRRDLLARGARQVARGRQAVALLGDPVAGGPPAGHPPPPPRAVGLARARLAVWRSSVLSARIRRVRS
jgi:hypothetical protein